MLNSKYAPVVAITVVLVLVVIGLGYFLAIKPQIDAASGYAARESAVRSNIQTINEDSAALDQAEKDLASAPDLTDITAFNATERPELHEFMTRLLDAVRTSNTEIRSVTVEGVTDVEPLEIPPAALKSTQLVAHFATVGTARQPGEPRASETFAPVVVPPVVDESVAGNLRQVDVMVSVKGRPEEIAAFLALMEDPDKRLFLTWDLSLEAKHSWDSAEAGLFGWLDGDATIDIRGSLFLLNPDNSVIDELTEGDYSLPTDPSPLEEPEGVEPQPGNPG